VARTGTGNTYRGKRNDAVVWIMLILGEIHDSWEMVFCTLPQLFSGSNPDGVHSHPGGGEDKFP
jgi:hypothetical protein